MEHLWYDTSHHPECSDNSIFAILFLQLHQSADEYPRGSYGIQHRFMPGTAHYVWMYSKEKDGVYEELKAPHVRNFVPSRAGFYKVKATDRVYSCESSLAHCLQQD